MCINIIIRLRDHLDADEPVPFELRCPLTLEWLEDPVITPAGTVYERKAIEEWLKQNPGKDPLRAVEDLHEDDLKACPELLNRVQMEKLYHRKFTIMC
jgi:SUMO ligase MMS21 Smc5/6 complex component